MPASPSRPAALAVLALAAGLAGAAAGADPAGAADISGAARALADSRIRAWASDPAVVAAVREQNARTAGLTEAEIVGLDRRWREETAGATAKPLVDSVLGNRLSAFLRDAKKGGEGLYTEIFVMDAKGLNVGQSDMTSDYWQGDEPKWRESFGHGPDALHLGEVEQDESTQAFQAQISLPVVDPAGREVIGAVTVGVDVELLVR
jgi:hypothetical protein